MAETKTKKTTTKPKRKTTQGGGKSTTTRSEQRPSPPRHSRRSPSSPPPHNIVAVYNHVAPIANDRFSSSPESRREYIGSALAQEMLRAGFPRATPREESARRFRAFRTARQYVHYLERSPNPRHARISSPGGSPGSRRSSQQGGKGHPNSSRESDYMKTARKVAVAAAERSPQENQTPEQRGRQMLLAMAKAHKERQRQKLKSARPLSPKPKN